MLFSVLLIRKFSNLTLIFLTVFSAAFVSASDAQAKVIVQRSGNVGIIKGIVRDEAGKAISDATVAIFRVGTSQLLKQVRSAADGSFLAKILPGTYSILAVAQGFNAVTLAEVEVNRSAELNYGFKLERAGNGRTLPETISDRKNPKYPMRAAQMQRSVYQATEGDAPIAESTIAETDEQSLEGTDGETASKRPAQTVVETYFASSDEGNYTGLNFARLQALGESAEFVIVGQTGTNKSAPKRFETNFKFRPNENHQIRIGSAIAKLGQIKHENQQKSLGQISFGASDEWKVREGIVVVFGFDYSKFIGAGNDFSISPRLGFQYDINSKTRTRAALTTQTEERNWRTAVALEDAQVFFREPVAVQDFVTEEGRPKISKARRLEFGVERVLDNKSTVEANVFFDTVDNRGVGVSSISFDALDAKNLADFVANQQGKARGARVVYTRRLNGIFSTSAGYAFGNSQKISEQAISTPANVFENGFAQTVFGQFDADFNTGTQIKTVFRLSPQATVFAIDPFQGRLAIYDPGLSVMVTQSLPTWGLPIRAEAVVDGRNLLDVQTGVNGEDGSLKLNLQRRNVRGGILVRF